MAILGKTISLFLIEGDPNKRWVCELSNWNGKAYKIPRIDVKRCDDRKDLTACGVYFLFGKSDSDEKGIVYIAEAEQAEMEEFLYNICLINNVLGHKVLEPLVVEESSDAEPTIQILHIQAARGANAKGMQTNEGFVVLKGSQVADTVTRSCPKQICTLRQKLIENGIIDANRTFTENRVFSSPSTAAGVVMGRSANGLTEWRTL